MHNIRRTIIVLALLLLATVAHAATYYVATTGNDANPGTLASPFSTLTKAFSVMGVGDTVYLRGGTYTQSINNNTQAIPNGTSWTNATTIASYPGETATLRPSGGSDAVNLPSANWIILDRLTIDGVNVTESSISHGSKGGHHLRVNDCEVKNADGPNIFAGVSSEILNSRIHNSQNSYGMYLTTADNLIANNDIYDNAGYAVQIYDFGSSSVDNHIVRNNRMWGNGFIRSTSAMTVGKGDNCKIYNNLIYNNFGGIDVHGTDEKVYNNTIYNNTPRAAIELQNSIRPVIRNNIMWGNAAAIVILGGTDAEVQSNNLTTDPLFTNAGASDFTLQAGSPAIDAGISLTSVFTTDFLGLPRPVGSAWDIGAYEFSTGAVPSAPLTPSIVGSVAGIDITLVWAASLSGSPTSYKVYWDTTPGTYGNNQSAGLALTDVVQGLTSGTTYYFNIAALNANGESAKSTTVSIVAYVPLPSRPQRLMMRRSG